MSSRTYTLATLPTPVTVTETGSRSYGVLGALVIDTLITAVEWIIRARRRGRR